MPPLNAKSTIRILSPIVILLACLIPYWNVLDNAFTYDDHYIIEANELIRSISPMEIFGNPFWRGFATEGSGTYYRPLVILSYSLDFACSGLEPVGYHLSNVMFHALTAFLVFLLARRLIRSDRAALLAGLLFAIHPVHTEAVSSAAGRSDVLATLFILATLLFYLSRRRFLRSLTFVPLFLALCSKEIALVTPALLLVCDLLWPRQRTSSAREWTRMFIRSHIPTVTAVAVFVTLRWIAVGNLAMVKPSPMDNPLIEHGLWTALCTLPAILWHYGRLLIYPVSLSIDYGFNQIPVTAEVGTGFLVCAAAIGILVLKWREVRRLSPTGVLALAVMGLPLLMTANPFVTAGSILSERYLYLPSAGLALLLSFAAHRYRPVTVDSRTRLRLGWGLIAVIVAAGGLRIADRNEDWRTDETLFASAVRETPNSVRARLNYAEIMSTHGEYASAARHYEHVLMLKSDYPIVNLKLAQALQRAGQAERALHYYEVTTRLNPAFVDAWSGLGTLSIRLGRDADAERALRSAVALAPHNAALYNQLGILYQKRGQTVKAIQAYELALAGDYRHPGVYCNLGIIYRQSGELLRARDAFDTALRIAPDMPLLHFHMGHLEQETGNTGSAIRHFERFLSTWRQDPGVVLQVQQNLEKLRRTS